VPLGRYSQPAVRGWGELYDLSHSVVVERGFKLLRFGDPAQALAHWDEVLTHPTSLEHYDDTPLIRPLARLWKLKLAP